MLVGKMRANIKLELVQIVNFNYTTPVACFCNVSRKNTYLIVICGNAFRKQ